MNLAPMAAQKLEWVIEPVTIALLDPYSHLVRTFDLAPLQGVALVGRVPGLKPWAESSSPFGFGAQISGRDLL
jgi:hypothetical protein